MGRNGDHSSDHEIGGEASSDAKGVLRAKRISLGGGSGIDCRRRAGDSTQIIGLYKVRCFSVYFSETSAELIGAGTER